MAKKSRVYISDEGKISLTFIDFDSLCLIRLFCKLVYLIS